jgi:NADPH-dependent ferric siderophore reductase
MSEKPARTPPRLLKVVRSQRIAPHLQRITLAGESLRGFPQQSHGAHMKIFLPRAHQQKPPIPYALFASMKMHWALPNMNWMWNLLCTVKAQTQAQPHIGLRTHNQAII